MDLARLPGVVAVADSEHRDRWGVDGWHAPLAADGDPQTAWLSDNWEVTHALALVFPRQVQPAGVQVTWAGDPPSHFIVELHRDGAWGTAADVRARPEGAVSTVQLAGGPADALRIVQPPDGANGDRQLSIADVAITGEPVEPALAVDAAALRSAIAAEMAALRAAEDSARVAPCLDVVMQRRKTAGFEGIIDRADLARGRRNIAEHPWAKRWAEAVVRDADWWVNQSDERLYALVPAGSPRALCPSFERGCPIHGGARQSFTATLEAPYRWKCRQGGEEWYDGAVVKNPGTGADVVVRDDGQGFLAPPGFPGAGRRYYFVAAYRYYVLGKLFSGPYEGDGGSEYQGGTPAVQLALAYAITGDGKYAHKAGVLLNRLAELYRTWDGCVEGPSQRQDGYIGQTFERFLVQNLTLCCDLIWDEVGKDDELIAFFKGKGAADYDGDGQVTGGDLTHNLQRNLLGYIYEYLHRLMPYMDGDFLMYEMTALAALAHVLQNPVIARETLESDLGLRVLLQNSWFRDGKFIYDSTGYNVGNAQTPLLIAEWLHGLTAPPDYAQPLDLYHDANYRVAMLYDFLRTVDCDGRPPQIGDCGGSREPALRENPAWSVVEERALLRLPEQRDVYTRRFLSASHGNPESYRGGEADWWLVFHAEDPPPADTQPVVDEDPSRLFEDSGIAVLRAGHHGATRLHVPLTFSKGAYGHGHTDKLAINVFRYGFDWTADLGYPTTWTDRKYGNWETDTASHCTVTLNGEEQRGNVAGRLEWYHTTPLVDAVEATCPAAYPTATDYRRTVAVVRDEAGEPLYTVDLFRAAGAALRDYRFHSLGKPEDMTVELDDPAAPWTAQPNGSLAGEGVEPTTGRGDSWLFDLHRAATAGGLTATWRPTGGTSQPDRYLLTRRSFGDCTVTFSMTRTGRASGDRERAVFVFATDPASVGDRRVIMMPVALPVGTPAQVKIEIHGGTAQMTLDGQPVGHVDVTGAPSETGSLGFLHYYNYAWEYRDLVVTPAGGEPVRYDLKRPLSTDDWARMEPTYTAKGGVLTAADGVDVGFRLRMLGAPGREVIRARAEGHGLRGQSPFEGHLVVRERPADPAAVSTFAAVLEPFQGEPRVVSVAPLALSPTDGATVGMAVTVATPAGPRTDYVLAAVIPHPVTTTTADGHAIAFDGCFALLATQGGKLLHRMVAGGAVAFDGDRRAAPAAFRGRVEALDGADRLVVASAAGSAAPGEALVGQVVRVLNPLYVCPAVYTVTAVEPAGPGRVALRVNLPFTVAHGTVRSVDAEAGAFATATPVMKLRVNPGLFDGKVARDPAGTDHRLTTAEEGAFKLADPRAIAAFKAGGEYTILDVGVGDEVEVLVPAT